MVWAVSGRCLILVKGDHSERPNSLRIPEGDKFITTTTFYPPSIG